MCVRVKKRMCIRSCERQSGREWVHVYVSVRVGGCMCVCAWCVIYSESGGHKSRKKFKQLKVGNWNDCDIIFARILFILQKKLLAVRCKKRTNFKTLAELFCEYIRNTLSFETCLKWTCINFEWFNNTMQI